MSDINIPREQLTERVEKLEKELEAERTEKGKIKTRLNGYETVAKLATEKGKENVELKKKVDELERTIEILTQKGPDQQYSREVTLLPDETVDKKTNNEVSSEDYHLTDVQSAVDTTNVLLTGSTSSFSIIGKCSRDSHLQQPNLAFRNSNSIAHNKNTDIKQDFKCEEHITMSLGINENRPVEKCKNGVKDAGHQYSSLPEIGGKTSGHDTFDEYIEVFPDTTQSGGSNCYGSSFEKDIEGQSCLDSSREGPLSLLDVCSESMSMYVQVEKKECDKNPIGQEDGKPVIVDAIQLPGEPVDASSYNGTGARPKQSVLQSRSASKGGKMSHENEAEENKTLLVKIPLEESSSFRINNAPMLSYGKHDSMTEISALTSFGSSLDSTSPDRVTLPVPYNDLNLGQPASLILPQATPTKSSGLMALEELKEDRFIPVPSTKLPPMETESLSVVAQRIRNILSSKINITETRNIILPFVERAVELEKELDLCQMKNKLLNGQDQCVNASLQKGEKENNTVRGPSQDERLVVNSCEHHGDNDKVSKETIITNLKVNITHLKEDNIVQVMEIEKLNSKNNQLHVANKEWKDRWESLKKQKENENLQLHTDVKRLTQENEQFKREMDNVIASLKQELLEATISKQESEKNYSLILSERSQGKQLLEKLKQDYGNLHQEKRALEIHVEDLSKKIAACSSTPKNVKNVSELETELALVKRQVTLFSEDFNKEHQEKVTLEMKLQREKDIHHSLESKLKKSNNLLKARDEELRTKTKQVSDLQYQIEDLKLKLEVEQRRASIYPSMDIPTTSSYSYVHQESSAFPYMPPSANPPHHKVVKPHTWNCSKCTFINKINYSKCEMCGNSNSGSDTRDLM